MSTAERWTRDGLIDHVTAHTKGTAGDPLGRDDVAQVVNATLAALGVELDEDQAAGDA